MSVEINRTSLYRLLIVFFCSQFLFVVLNHVGFTEKYIIVSFLIYTFVIFLMALLMNQLLEGDVYSLVIPLFGIVLRCIVIIAGTSAKFNVYLPMKAGDADNFYISARNIISGDSNALVFPYIIAFLIKLFGDNRILVQEFNVLIYILTAYTAHCYLRYKKYSNRLIDIAHILLAFFPTYVSLCGLLLREPIQIYIGLLVYIISLEYLDNSRKEYIVLGVILIILGGFLHGAFWALLSGPLSLFLFYDIKEKKWIVKKKMFLIFMGLIISSLLILNFFPISFINAYIPTSWNDIVARFNRYNTLLNGRTDYLKDWTVTQPWELLLYIPVKTFYYFVSPVPWEWKNLIDLISFISDSVIYILFWLFTIISLFKSRKEHRLSVLVIVELLPMSVAYALGTVNAGTALRHRCLLFAVAVIWLIHFVKNWNEKRNANLNKAFRQI